MPNIFKTYPMNGIGTTSTTIHTATDKSVIIGLDICNTGGTGGALDLNLVRNSRIIDKYWRDNNTSFTDITSDMAVAGGTAFNPFTNDATSVAAEDDLYVGSLSKFSSVDFNVTTNGAGAGPVIDWQYYNGSTWTSLSGGNEATFVFTGGTGTQNLNFTVPTDWAKTSVNGESGSYYYIRGDLTTAYSTTEPLIDEALPKGLTMEFLKGTPLPIGSTLQAISGQKTVLEANDSINLATSTSEVSAILTVLEDVN